MRKSKGLVMAACCVSLVAGAFRAVAEDQPAAVAEKKATVAQSVFVCPDCQALALKAGKCAKCDKELAKQHVLGVKDGQALLCACSTVSKPTAENLKDNKCGCGKEVKKMSMKGMYVCADGCPQIADGPGKCACGKDLKKVE